MKKLLTLCLTLCAVLTAFAVSACATDGRPSESAVIEQGYSICYAFTASDVETHSDGNTSVYDYMQALSSEGKIVFDGYTSDYGYYLTSVLGVSEKTQTVGNTYKGYAWAVYTTLTSVDGVVYSQEESVFVYGGVTMYKASYGVSGLPCIEGETYALVYEYSEMSW